MAVSCSTLRRLLAAVPLLLVGCSGSAQKAAPTGPEAENLPDVDYRRKESLTLSREKDSWVLTRATRVSIKYLTRRATRRVTHSVYEPFYAKVKDLEAEKDGSSLSSDDIEKVTVQRTGILFQDDHRYLLKFKSVDVGQTVSWSYQQTYDDIGWTPPIFVRNRDRVSRYEVEVNHPPGVKVDFELFFPRQRFRPTITRSPRRTSITFANLPHPQPLEFFGRLNSLHVAIWPQAREGDREINPISAREFLRWQARREQAKPQAPLSAADRALAGKIVAGVSPPKEKLGRVYDWVRKNVRYVADERGLHGQVPHSPSYVLKKRFGDCKDLSNLVIKLAAAAGVTTQKVFVGVKPSPRFAGTNDYMFDHQIGAYRDGDRWLFFDPVCDHCEFGNLPEMDVDKPALILSGDEGERLTIPPPPQRPSVEVMIEARVDGLVSAPVTITLRNGRFWETMEIKRLPEAKQRVRLSKMLSKDLYKILLSEIEIEKVADDHARLSASADLSEFVVKTDRRLYLPVVAIRTADGDLLERKGDEYPIRLGWRDNVLLQVKLSAPGYTPKAAQPLALGSKQTATVRSSLSQQQGAFMAEYRFWQHRKHFQGQQRAALLELYASYLRSRRKMFVLERTAGETDAGNEQRSSK